MEKETTKEHLSQEQQDDILKAYELIYGAFSWHLTSSGGEYWYKVATKLYDLGGRERKEKTDIVAPEIEQEYDR